MILVLDTQSPPSFITRIIIFYKNRSIRFPDTSKDIYCLRSKLEILHFVGDSMKNGAFLAQSLVKCVDFMSKQFDRFKSKVKDIFFFKRNIDRKLIY